MVLPKNNLLINILIVCFIAVGCDTPFYEIIIPSNDEETILSVQFTPKPNLPKDASGYYHITLGGGYQTIHTLHGIVHRGADTLNGINVLKVGWGSNLTWLWDGYEIPTINGASYSREDGSVSQTIGLTHELKGDTMIVFTGWYDDWKDEEGYGEPFFIVIH
jgi:hypothetical protein